MKTKNSFTLLPFLFALLFLNSVHAQFPVRALVGYYETWNADVPLSNIHSSYNVINLAFAVTTFGSTCELKFDLPTAYSSKIQFLNEIDALHSKNKVILISIGGETGQISLNSEGEKNTLVNSLKNIFAAYNYKIDGIDIDIEGAPIITDDNTWTMTNPSSRQQFLIAAIKEIMADYQSHTSKKMCLTMAPEVAFVQGGLSDYQILALNGGWYLPIIEALRDELDMLNCQLYNVYGEAYAIDGGLHMEGSGNFIAAMVESAIRGFALKSSKGVYSGLPANKVGFGTVGNNNCASYDAGSLMNVSEIISAVKYLRGKADKPVNWQYNRTSTYPSLKGMMVWSINKDYNENGTGICDDGSWANAASFLEAFPAEDNANANQLLDFSKLNIFPNPAVAELYVNNRSSQNIEIKLLNELGVEVKTISLDLGFNTIATDQLNAGLYYLKTSSTAYKVIIK